MSKIHVVQSSVLNRPVFFATEAHAKTFATEQTDHTGTPHAAEAVEVHEGLTKIDAAIDQAHRDKLHPTLNPGQRRALGIVTNPTTTVRSAAVSFGSNDNTEQ